MSASRTSLLGGSFGALLGRLGFAVVGGLVLSLGGVGLALGFGGVGLSLGAGLLGDGLTLGLGGVGLSLGAGLRGGSFTARRGGTGALSCSGPNTRDGSIPFFFIILRIILSSTPLARIFLNVSTARALLLLLLLSLVLCEEDTLRFFCEILNFGFADFG